MKNEILFGKETDAEIRELVKLKIDIYKLTQEDIDYLFSQASSILNDKKQTPELQSWSSHMQKPAELKISLLRAFYSLLVLGDANRGKHYL